MTFSIDLPQQLGFCCYCHSNTSKPGYRPMQIAHDTVHMKCSKRDFLLARQHVLSEGEQTVGS